MTYHKPVLMNEVIEHLNIKPHGVYVDVTFGGGGHSRAILEAEPTCRVIAFDWDMVAIESNSETLLQEFPDRFQLVWANFSQVDRHLKKIGVHEVDGILGDFGTSQYQLIERPGFSFAKDTPLDMRMAPSHQRVTAADVLNRTSEAKLTQIFKQLGQEPKSRIIARLIVEQRAVKRFKTTKDLTQLIQKVYPVKTKKIHPATLVFQALRIHVNKELENIQSFLPASLRVLKPGGRLVCISFHSLEDRLVKEFFRQQEGYTINLLTKKVVVAQPEELEVNPSARSARLRAVEKR